MTQNVDIMSAHALSHQACPYVLGISRLAPPCAVAIRIAHFRTFANSTCIFKLPLWLSGNTKILAKSCAFERKNLQIVHKIKRKFERCKFMLRAGLFGWVGTRKTKTGKEDFKPPSPAHLCLRRRRSASARSARELSGRSAANTQP